MRHALVLSWTSLCIMLGGCVQTREHTNPEVPAPNYQVKCGGECLELQKRGVENRPALLRKVEELFKEQRLASIEVLIERHAEAVIEILRQRAAKQPPTEAELKLACGIDALMQHPTEDGWQHRLQGRGRGGLEQAETSLRGAQELTRHQQWAKAAELLQKNQAAVAPYPYHAIQSGLILAEAQRHLDQAKAASKTWQQTAGLAARLSPKLQVPDLWEQIAAQRPVSAMWPGDVAAAMAPRLPQCLHGLSKDPAFVPEALVWYTIGNARLTRAEASEALTAFKRADSHGAFPQWDDFLTLHQAKALLAMQQTPAATSLLTTLVGRPSDSPWRSSALALLGSGKLQEGHTQQAFAFLREAVESGNADFIWRADAEANLGLAYLMAGDEGNGIRLLHGAQVRFAAARDLHGLLQCLENEASYLQSLGKTEDTRRVRERIQQLELPAR
jgi:tetratricopeptide (TPR) repeat protein